MKLLLIGPKVDAIENVRNFSGVWAYYLPRELRRLGIEYEIREPIHNRSEMVDVDKVEWHYNIDVTPFDGVLALGTRYFDRLPKACGQAIQRNVHRKGRGVVGQIHDGPTYKSPCDVTFHIKPDMKFPTTKAKNANCHVGWAADEQFFFPQQRSDLLRILIDHSQLVGGEPEDFTQDIIEQTQAFARHYRYQRAILLRHIIDGGVITIDPGSSYRSRRYERKTIPLDQIAIDYRATDIFLVTHPESVGYSILETAMCGALPVVPQGAASTLLLSSIRSFRYTGGVIPWEEVLEFMDADLSRAKAIDNDWKTVAEKIVAYYERFL